MSVSEGRLLGIVLPESQRLSLHYFSDRRHTIGVRTVCENNNYLARQNRNINKLYRYAEKPSCLKILKTYLEVLV